MRSLLLLSLPALGLLACEDDGDSPIVIPELEANYELPANIAALYEGQEHDAEGPTAAGSSVRCEAATGDWTLETAVTEGATGVLAFWWDLEELSTGGAEALVDQGGGVWTRTSTSDSFGRACDDGPFVLVVIPVGAGSVPGVAELAPYLPSGENLIDGGGYSKVGLTLTVEVATDTAVDAVDLHALNPYNSVYLGPQALEAESASSWSGEVALDTELGASEVGGVWVAFAGFAGGELVGVGGL